MLNDFSAFLLTGTIGVPFCKGADFWPFPASNTISMTLLLASRLFAEIARVYTSSVIRELA